MYGTYICGKCKEPKPYPGNPLFLWLAQSLICDRCSKELQKEIDFSKNSEAIEPSLFAVH